MQEFFQSLTGWLAPLFVISAMLNVGLTQNPKRIVRNLRNWQYLARMVLVNFLVVPAIMLFFIEITEVAGPYAIGLTLFSVGAGAPLLIKLTSRSQNEIAAGATVQMVLMVGTVIAMPLLLQVLLDDITVSSWDIVSNLLFQMILPMVVGMVLLTFAESFTAVVQPWVARLSNLALYGMLVTPIFGNLSAFADAQMWITIITGVLALLVAFFIGHNTGIGKETDSQIGALGTAQRNTAAAVIVAQSSFADDPEVFLTIVLVNTIMMFVLLFLATLMSKDIKLALLEPLEADPPRRQARRS